MPRATRPTAARPVVSGGYTRPYLDSSVFIAWLKGEVVTRKSGEVVDRANIAEHILQLAERGA